MILGFLFLIKSLFFTWLRLFLSYSLHRVRLLRVHGGLLQHGLPHDRLLGLWQQRCHGGHTTGGQTLLSMCGQRRLLLLLLLLRLQLLLESRQTAENIGAKRLLCDESVFLHRSHRWMMGNPIWKVFSEKWSVWTSLILNETFPWGLQPHQRFCSAPSEKQF